MALTAVAWCIVGVRGHILHEPFPRNTLFWMPEYRFTDFTEESLRAEHFGMPHVLTRTDLGQMSADPFPYPPPTIYAYLAFVAFPRPLVAYLIFVLLSFFAATCYFSWRVKRAAPGHLPQLAIWSTFLMGFPLAFLIDRGNIEGVIWVLILLGLFAFTRNRMVLAVLLWGLAASMKIYPGLLFVLFLAKRKYRIFALAIAATAAFTVLALAGIGPTVGQAAADSAHSQPFLLRDFILVRHTPGFDHSLFGAIKQIMRGYISLHTRQFGLDTRPAFGKALRVYNILIPLCALLLYWFRLRRFPLLNQFMAYMLLCVILPYISYEYTLINIYLVWGAFLLFLLSDVATGRISIPARAIHTILISCAVIFVPLSYLLIGNNPEHMIAFGGQVQLVFIAIILWTVLRTPMPSSLFGDLRSHPTAS